MSTNLYRSQVYFGTGRNQVEFALLFQWQARTLNNVVCSGGNRVISDLFILAFAILFSPLDSAQLNQLLLMGTPDDLRIWLLLVKKEWEVKSPNNLGRK